jgi:type I restriction enzyme S subunit
MSWQTVKLGDVSDVISGATPKTGQKEYWGGDIYWATPKDLSGLNEKVISKTDRRITHAGLSSCAAKLLPIDSVLFSSRAPIGLVAINSMTLATNQGFKSFVTDKKRLDPSYLYWWLKSNRSYINSLGVGATFKEVSKSIVERIEIPLPPLAEQKRIAAILDKADEIRRKREQTIAKLDQLAQSIFVEMFADDFMSSKQQISDFFSINDNRFDMNKEDKDLIPFIAMSSVSELSKRVIVNEHRLFADVKKGYTPIKFADLIVAKITPCYENGKMAIVDSIDDDYAFGSTEFHTFRSSNSDLTTLLYYYLKQPNVMFTGARKMKGAAGQKRVPDSFFRNLPFFIPPKSKLDLFNDAINVIKCEINLANEALTQQTQLFASLQHQAFTGNL